MSGQAKISSFFRRGCSTRPTQTTGNDGKPDELEISVKSGESIASSTVTKGQLIKRPADAHNDDQFEDEAEVNHHCFDSEY